jgi:hypothetical protein
LEIGNIEILQACATTLAGVLIFLTIERKFDLATINKTISQLDNEIGEEYTKYLQLKPEFDRQKKEVSGQYHAEERGEELWKKYSEKSEASADRYNKLIMKRSEPVKEQERISQQYKLENIQDVVTITTLSLLAACIIFMILIDADWKTYWIDYPMISRALFALGLVSLLIRVGLRVKN